MSSTGGELFDKVLEVKNGAFNKGPGGCFTEDDAATIIKQVSVSYTFRCMHGYKGRVSKCDTKLQCGVSYLLSSSPNADARGGAVHAFEGHRTPRPQA